VHRRKTGDRRSPSEGLRSRSELLCRPTAVQLDCIHMPEEAVHRPSICGGPYIHCGNESVWSQARDKLLQFCKARVLAVRDVVNDTVALLLAGDAVACSVPQEREDDVSPCCGREAGAVLCSVQHVRTCGGECPSCGPDCNHVGETRAVLSQSCRCVAKRRH